MKTQHILSLSYGKDSLACLGAIEHLGWPLDRIVTVDVWATDDIPGELPPMAAFKRHVDAVIRERYGIEVEHYHATRNGEKMTYEKLFYTVRQRGRRAGEIVGFPTIGRPECNSKLKMAAVREMRRAIQETGGNVIEYVGIAADEPERIARHSKKESIKLPLVELGWEEDLCGLWCKYNDLLSPTYETTARDGCWFCPNQRAEQLRSLRRRHPHLWAMLLRWDADSPIDFKADGQTVRDYDRRFQGEDEGWIPTDRTFRWSMIHQ